MLWLDLLLGLRRWLRAFAIALSAFVSCSTPSHSEVSVQGTAAAARVDAREAPLSEVLSALGTSFNVRHEVLTPLDDVIIDGSYSGTLEEVLRRMLTGLNYVIKTRKGTVVEVVIVGRPGDPPAEVANKTPALPTNTNPAAQWRRPAPPKR